jgi:hypothetical protein
MLMDGPVSARKRPINTKTTETSSDQNPLFLIDIESESTRPPPRSKAPVDTNNPPPKSVRSLYNDRYQMELATSAGRALREHIGGGHIVLMDATPRAQRYTFIFMITHMCMWVGLCPHPHLLLY